MRRLAMGALAVLLMGAPWPARGQDREEIQQMLDRRASYVRAKQREAFMSTVDPRSGGFKIRQARLFDRMSRLPIDSYSLRHTIEEFGEFTRARDRQRHGGRVVVAGVEERYRIKGFDEVPDLNDLVYTFVRRGQSWLIADDDPLEDLGAPSDREPWDYGNVQTLRRGGFLVVYHRGDDLLASDVASRAAAAARGVERVWRSKWSGRVPVYVPGGLAELEGLLAAPFDLDNFVAFAAASLDLEAGFDFVGTRILLNPENFRAYSKPGRERILVHELVHVATRRAAGPFMPTWVEEGLAVLAEGGSPLNGVLASLPGFTGRVPEDLRFISGNRDEIGRAYLEAASAVGYMRNRFGVGRMNRFYRTLGAARMEPGTAEYHVDRAMRATLKVSLRNFEMNWAAYLRR